MDCVSQRIKNRLNVAVDFRIVEPNVGHRQRNIFGKSTRSINANSLGVFAQVPQTRHAVSTSSTNNMPFAADDISCVKVGDVATYFDNFADKLMADHHRYGNGLLSPFVPVVYVDISTANSRSIDTDQDIIDADFWHVDFFENQSDF